MYLLRGRKCDENILISGVDTTYKPLGWISNILSLTRSPISLTHALTESRSFASGHEAVCKVDESNFFMYVLRRSASNFGRGDDASERWGERKLVGLAIRDEIRVSELFLAR